MREGRFSQVLSGSLRFSQVPSGSLRFSQVLSGSLTQQVEVLHLDDGALV